jgi:hypothetical protein
MELSRIILFDIYNEKYGLSTTPAFIRQYPRIAYAFGETVTINLCFAAIRLDCIELFKICGAVIAPAMNDVVECAIIHNSEKCLEYFIENHIQINFDRWQIWKAALKYDNVKVQNIVINSLRMSTIMFVYAAKYGRTKYFQRLCGEHDAIIVFGHVEAIFHAIVKHNRFDCLRIILEITCCFDMKIYYKCIKWDNITMLKILIDDVEEHNKAADIIYKSYEFALKHSSNDGIIAYLEEKLKFKYEEKYGRAT